MPYTKQNTIRLWSVASLLLLIALCISECGTTHQTYSYHGPASFNGNQDAGSSLAVQWQAQPGQVTTDNAPQPLLLAVFLIGPFQYIDDVLGAIRKYKNDPILTHMGPIVASAPPLQTNNWTNKTLTSTISIPTTLQSAYYILALTVNGDSATRANAIIHIYAHT